MTEAADALGVTVDAIRSRVKRGTMAHVREGGRVYVLLGDDEYSPGHDQDTDQGGERLGDQDPGQPEDRTAELISTLREQLQAERQAHAEARRLLAAALERIPAIEAPLDERDAPEPVEEEPEGAQHRSDAPGPQTGAQRRPWWRRILGGR